jgi:hypothetical protein
MPSAPLLFRNSQDHTEAFLRHVGIYLVRCGFPVKTKPQGGNRPPPAGRPRARVEERVGRTTLPLIVRR